MSTISPCMNICQYNELLYCIGCRRHIREIGRWRHMSDEEARWRIDRLSARNIGRAFDPAENEYKPEQACKPEEID